MNIVVCVKQVPDTAARVMVTDGAVSWGDAPLVLNPWDEYAVEAALLQGGDVTVMSMGTASAAEALKHSLAMGCKEAVLISDSALANADTQATARVLAAAIQKKGDVDLVVFGKAAIDGDGGVTAAQTARALGWPIVSLVAAFSEADGGFDAARAVEEGRQMITGKLPAVISVVKDIGEPRYPSFMGIRKASRAEIPTWSLADLGIDAPTSHVEWPELIVPDSKEVVCEFIEGATLEAKAGALADKLIAEKVI